MLRDSESVSEIVSASVLSFGGESGSKSDPGEVLVMRSDVGVENGNESLDDEVCVPVLSLCPCLYLLARRFLTLILIFLAGRRPLWLLLLLETAGSQRLDGRGAKVKR